MAFWQIHANIKRFLAFGVLMSALANILMGWSSVLWVWVVLWALNGWFQGFGAPAGVVSMSQWFSNRGARHLLRHLEYSTPHRRRADVCPAFRAGKLVRLARWISGAGDHMCGPCHCDVLFPGRPASTLELHPVSDWKNDHPAQVAGIVQKPQTTWQMQISILAYPWIWILAISCAAMTMTRYAMNDWGMLYLQEAKGYSGVEAGGLLALKSLAGMAGSASYGFVSDKLFGARRPPMNLVCGVLEILALVVMFAIPPGHPLVITAMLLIFGYAITGLITSLGGLFAVDIAPKAAGAAMGFIGVFSYVGAAIQERISGVLIGNGTTFYPWRPDIRFSQGHPVLAGNFGLFPAARNVPVRKIRGKRLTLRRGIMSGNSRYDVVIIGNYTKDTIISPAGTRYVDGGGP